MDPSTTIRCGVAGVGYLGQHHARIYSEMEGATLAGVYDINPARAKEIAGMYGGSVFATLEEMGEACDAISVAVPTDHHCEVALPLLERKCHLLVEKPLCATMAETERLLTAAQRSGMVVQVGHIEHFNPAMTYLEDAVRQPRFITADRLAPFTTRGTEVSVVLDLMIHDIGIVLQLVKSPIERIDAVGVSVLTQTEDIANARITFADGCVANLNTSRVSTKKVREIRVFQPYTYLSLDFMNQSGHLMRLGKGGLEREDIPIDRGEPLALELQGFIGAVRKREDPKVPASLGKTALEVAIQVIDEIQRGAARLP